MGVHAPGRRNLHCSGQARARAKRRPSQQQAAPMYTRYGVSPCSGRLVACAASKDWSHMSMEELMEALLARGQDPIGSKEKLAERLAALEGEDSDDSDTEARPRQRLRDGQQWRIRERPTFPDCGPMPDISSVRINDLEQELRRRGVPIVGYRKQDLYDLVQLAMERKSQASTLSDAELARWLLERGVLPQGTREELTALVSAGMVAETGGSVGSEFGSFTRDDLLDPSFDPSELTIPQLKGILRGFNASTLGRKAELVDRVSAMLEVASMGLHAPQSALALSDRRVKREARRIVEAMPVEQCREELRKRGHSAEGPPERVQERLQLVLIVDSQREATGQAPLQGTVHPPDDGKLERDLPVDDAVDDAPSPLKYSFHNCTHLMLMQITERVRVAVIAGGPSPQAALSLASARTVVQALQTQPFAEQQQQLEEYLRTGASLTTENGVQNGQQDEVELLCRHGVSVDVYYIDSSKRPWKVPHALVFAATPAALELKLASVATPLETLEAMAADIKEHADVALPVVHGAFGEGGELLCVLEGAGVNYVGSGAAASGAAFNKVTSRDALMAAGFPVLQQFSLSADDFEEPVEAAALTEGGKLRMTEWAKETNMDVDSSVVVVKPADGVAGIGVSTAKGADAATAAAASLLAQKMTTQVIIEPKLLGAIEFSVSVVQTPSGVYALPPTSFEFVDYELDIRKAERDLEVKKMQQQEGYFEHIELFDDEEADSLLTYGRKQLPCDTLRQHTPALLPVTAVQAIRRSAERAFTELGLRDCARFDGWAMIDAQDLARFILGRYIVKNTGEYNHLDPGDEELLAGKPPGVEGQQFERGIDLTKEELAKEESIPVHEANEDAFFVNERDRYYTASQLAAIEAAEAQAEEEEARIRAENEANGIVTWPKDPKRVAFSRPNPELPLVALPPVAWEKDPMQLAGFHGGVIVFSEVNPVGSMEASGLLFQQAAAVGLSHAALLRNLVNNALARIGRMPLPPPQEGTRIDPITAAQIKDFPELSAMLNAEDEFDGEELDELMLARYQALAESIEAAAGDAEEHGEGDGQEGRAASAVEVSPGGAECSDEEEGTATGSSSSATAAHALRVALMAAMSTMQALPPADRQKVYVLCGGDSAQRHISLASAVTTWLHLRKYPDIEATLFVLAPHFSGLRERTRRKELLNRRAELLLLGLDEENIAPELTIDAVRRPKLKQAIALENRMVWAVPHALALRRNVDELVEACELLLKTRQTAEHSRALDAQELQWLVQQMCWELDVGGVQGVSSTFEGLGLPNTATSNVRGFLKQAQVDKAVVFNLVSGDCGEDGSIQQMIDAYGIPRSGSGELASQVCYSKVDTSQHIKELSEHAIYHIPQFELNVNDLIMLSNEPGYCEPALRDVRDQLQLDEDASVCIKPTQEGGSTGVMQLDDERDFHMYAQAVAHEWAAVPADSVPGSPYRYVIEPFIACDAMSIGDGPGGTASLSHRNVNGFIEVTIGVYGMAGYMHAMTPSVMIKRGGVLSYEEKFETGAGTSLTPPPAELARPEALAAAREKAEIVANALGVNGCAQIDAFMNAEDGSLYIIEVNTVPPLTPSSPLFQQGLAESPPLYPNEFVRLQVLIAISESPQPHEDNHPRHGAFEDAGGGWDFSEPAQGDHQMLLENELEWIEGVS